MKFTAEKRDEITVRLTQDKVSGISRTGCPIKTGLAVRLSQD